MSVHRKSRTKAARKSKGQKDGHEVCENEHFEVPPSSLAPHPDCTKLLDDIPSFEWDNADDLWERLEEEDWMGIVSVKFFNPVTRKLRKSPPGERNVCSYIHTTFDNQEIEVFAPLKCAESLGKVVVKTGSVEKWSDIEQLWSYGLTFREVQHELLKGILQTKMEENARLQFGLLGAAEEIARLREEMVCAEQLQQEMKKNTRLLHDQLEAKELALQEKNGEIADHKKHAKLLEDKEEEYARLQGKLDMISCFLSGTPQKSPTSIASSRSPPPPPPSVARMDQERRQQIELKRNLAVFTITRAVRARGEQIKHLKNSAALRLQQMLRDYWLFKASRRAVDDKLTVDDCKSVDEPDVAPHPAHVKIIPSTLPPASASEASPAKSSQPQRAAPVNFVVDCTHNKALSGMYTVEGLDVYKHVDARFVLSLCSGRWTIKDKGRVVCKAVDAALHPDYVQNWLYLNRQYGTFRPAFPMTVKEQMVELPLTIPQSSAARAVNPYVEQAADWVHVEKRDGFFVAPYYVYYNKITGEKRKDIPEILRK